MTRGWWPYSSGGALHLAFGGLNRALRNWSLFRHLVASRDDKCEQESWTFGLNIYTPTDVRSFAPVLDDRPYAGWVFAIYSFTTYKPEGDDVATLDLNIGFVGPAVHGGDIQNWMHTLANVRYPEDGALKIIT